MTDHQLHERIQRLENVVNNLIGVCKYVVNETDSIYLLRYVQSSINNARDVLHEECK